MIRDAIMWRVCHDTSTILAISRIGLDHAVHVYKVKFTWHTIQLSCHGYMKLYACVSTADENYYNNFILWHNICQSKNGYNDTNDGKILLATVYPKKYAHGFCFVVLCCGYTLTDFPISIRLTSLALWQSNDCPSASKATLINMDKYFMWIHYERLHNHNKAKHNKTVCIFLGIYCRCVSVYFLETLWMG